VLHSFVCATDGCGLYGSLTFDPKGNLYGTTIGGSNGPATIFELTPDSGSWKLKVLRDFVYSEGDSLVSGLALDPSGDLYGTALGGGTYDDGTVFELTPGSGGWSLDVLHSFNFYGGDGYGPWAPVVLDKSGDLYGTTQGNTVFKIAPSGGDWNESVIYDFTAKGDGGNPEAGLIWDAVGNLYSTTVYGGVITKGCEGGCGTVFKLSPVAGGGWKGHVLYQFKWVPGGPDGYSSYASVTFDKAGNLYGTTAYGGSSNACFSGCGTVFKLTPTKRGPWAESVIHSFKADKNGNAPFAEVVLDKAGNLYGTAQRGGIGQCQGGCGVVFKLTPSSQGKWTYTVLHRFTGPPDGAVPNAGLIFDQSGKHLYGTTILGGANGVGTVFELTP
jgi:uncharacterized repeat protein (TIGR03803 family)